MPDKKLLELLDAMILWFHDHGVPRIWVLRMMVFSVITTQLAQLAFESTLSELQANIIAVIFTALMLYLHSIDEKHKDRPMQANARLLFLRENPFMAWVRMCIILLMLSPPYLGWWDFISDVLYGLWYYLDMTISPMFPPRRRTVLVPALAHR